MRLSSRFAAVLLALCAAAAEAQVGLPGVSNPPTVISSATVAPVLSGGVTVNGTAETILFKLDGNNDATQTFLSFTNVATPANFITMEQGTSTPRLTTTVGDGSTTGFFDIQAGAGQWRYSNPAGNMVTDISHSLFGPTSINLFAETSNQSTAADLRHDRFTVANNGPGIGFATYALSLRDDSQDDWLIFTSVTTPGNVITHSRDVDAPRLTTTVDNGLGGSSEVVVAAGTQFASVDDAGTSGDYRFFTWNYYHQLSDGTGFGSIELTVDGPGVRSATGVVLNGAGGEARWTINPETSVRLFKTNDGVTSGEFLVEDTLISTSVEDGTGTVTATQSVRGTHAPYFADVASAATITPRGNVFHVSGTTNIDTITVTTAGTCYTLIFDDVLTVGDLSGNINLSAAFVSTANDTLSLCHDGTTWFETARSVN